jgi:hypothetical protein
VQTIKLPQFYVTFPSLSSPFLDNFALGSVALEYLLHFNNHLRTRFQTLQTRTSILFFHEYKNPLAKAAFVSIQAEFSANFHTLNSTCALIRLPCHNKKKSFEHNSVKLDVNWFSHVQDRFAAAHVYGASKKPICCAGTFVWNCLFKFGKTKALIHT